MRVWSGRQGEGRELRACTAQVRRHVRRRRRRRSGGGGGGGRPVTLKVPAERGGGGGVGVNVNR